MKEATVSITSLDPTTLLWAAKKTEEIADIIAETANKSTDTVMSEMAWASVTALRHNASTFRDQVKVILSAQPPEELG